MSQLQDARTDRPEAVLEAVDLRCAGAAEPLGIGTRSPRLSWAARSTRRGAAQSAYQVVVGLTPEVCHGGDVLWDSGELPSELATGVDFGCVLASRTRYYWSVRLADELGRWGDFAPVASFETAILDQGEWTASWLACATNRPRAVSPMFRTEFAVVEPVLSARAYVTGLGHYELSLNGVRVGRSVLDPGWTDVRKRVLFSTYDVTDFIHEGANAVGVRLGVGRFDEPPNSLGRPRTQFLLQLHLNHGRTETVVVSDGRSGWIATPDGPIIDHSLYDGETYDARAEIDGWDLPQFVPDSASWAPAVIAEPPPGVLTAQPCEPIEVIEELVPVAITEPSPGVFVCDFGQNFAGWAQLSVSGTAGTRVVLRHAEMLHDDGTVNQTNLRSARATDTFILRGTGEIECYEPRFTYHGFRFVQVEGLDRRPESGSIRGRVVRSAVRQTGRFRSSDDFLNRLHQAIVRTEGSNLHSIPTDCPQRDERLGWLNDMSVRATEAVCNFDLRRLLAKWVDDIADTQGAVTGAIADTAPWVRHGARPADPVAVSFLLVPWLLYEHFGDDATIRRRYADYVRWFRYLESISSDSLLELSRYGDWAPPIAESVGTHSVGAGAVAANTPGGFVSSSFYCYTATLLAQFAAVLGLDHDREEFTRAAARIRLAINRRYFDGSTGNYGSGNQACNALALHLGLPEPADEKRVLANLVRDVAVHDDHLTTGNLTTKYLIDVLTDHGQGEVAWALVSQRTYPSWGYMLDQGATTIWERWEHVVGGDLAGMGSHNHPMYGAVGSWFYTHLAGIDLRGSGLAGARPRIRPYPLGGLTSVDCELLTGRGTLAVHWRSQPARFELDVSIPVGCVAEVYLPIDGGTPGIEESGTPVWVDGGLRGLVPGVQAVSLQADAARLVVGSGNYRFTVSYSPGTTASRSRTIASASISYSASAG